MMEVRGKLAGESEPSRPDHGVQIVAGPIRPHRKASPRGVHRGWLSAHLAFVHGILISPLPICSLTVGGTAAGPPSWIFWWRVSAMALYRAIWASDTEHKKISSYRVTARRREHERMRTSFL